MATVTAPGPTPRDSTPRSAPYVAGGEQVGDRDQPGLPADVVLLDVVGHSALYFPGLDGVDVLVENPGYLDQGEGALRVELFATRRVPRCGHRRHCSCPWMRATISA
jgi:hypothetical protein